MITDGLWEKFDNKQKEEFQWRFFETIAEKEYVSCSKRKRALTTTTFLQEEQINPFLVKNLRLLNESQNKFSPLNSSSLLLPNVSNSNYLPSNLRLENNLNFSNLFWLVGGVLTGLGAVTIIGYGIYKLYNHYNNKEEVEDNNFEQSLDYKEFPQSFDLTVQEQQEKGQAKQTITTTLYSTKWLESLPKKYYKLKIKDLDVILI